MHRGFVKVYRKLEDSGILKDSHACQFFLWAMLKATHKPHKQIIGNQVVDLEPGQFVSGRKVGAEEMGISPSKFVRTAEKMKMLGFLDSKPNNKFTVFTIVKWDTYQKDRTAGEQQTEQQADNKRTTSEHQADTNKNAKNIKNIKNIKNDLIPENLSAYAEFATRYQNHIASTHGAKAPKVTDVLIKRCAEEIDKLVRIDGHSFDSVQATMRWAIKDSFWAPNAMSLGNIRAKGDDGRTKFQKILAAKDRESIPQAHRPLTAAQIQAMCAVN